MVETDPAMFSRHPPLQQCDGSAGTFCQLNVPVDGRSGGRTMLILTQEINDFNSQMS